MHSSNLVNVGKTIKQTNKNEKKKKKIERYCSLLEMKEIIKRCGWHQIT